MKQSKHQRENQEGQWLCKNGFCLLYYGMNGLPNIKAFLLVRRSVRNKQISFAHSESQKKWNIQQMFVKFNNHFPLVSMP